MEGRRLSRIECPFQGTTSRAYLLGCSAKKLGVGRRAHAPAGVLSEELLSRLDGRNEPEGVVVTEAVRAVICVYGLAVEVVDGGVVEKYGVMPLLQRWRHL